MSNNSQDNSDKEFAARRQLARVEVNKLDHDIGNDETARKQFFNTVYDRALKDAAQIPWADMAPKSQISQWLKANPGNGKCALDVACGLGDNAEEISRSGYQTTAFDLSQTAIDWALRRFEKSKVHYLSANMFEPPADWQHGFDLVNECYTLQALPPPILEKSIRAICNLVKPMGTLLIYTRLRDDDVSADGPPWPLLVNEAMSFAQLGFDLISDERFVVTRGEREITHQFAHWQKQDISA